MVTTTTISVILLAPDGGENDPDSLVQFVIDKRREMSRGFLNDVNNNTARPKTATKFCQALK